MSATAPAQSPLERLKEILAELADLGHAEQILDWDSRVSMPRGGANARADVAATLAEFSHQRFVTDEVGELLERLAADEDPDSADGALVRVTRREWDRARRIPSDLAGELAQANGVGVAAWDDAKKSSDFALFRPHLERQLELKHQYIACFPEVDEPYDALLDEYEEGLTTAKVEEVFGRLKGELVELVERHRDDVVEDLKGPFPVAAQHEAGRLVLEAFGWDPSSWRLDETPHPFASKPGAGDIRLTTHTDERDITSLFSTMHEFGHGVYEFDIDRSFARTPLGGGTSSAIHESQSRTWENLVGRSAGFWRWFYPQLQGLFPDALGGIGESSFVRAVSAVRPGLIRGDADEVTYGLHIILRFELERELLAGTVEVQDLPDVWNARMREYLGVEVPDDAHGVLQDMHWSAGLFGYFPTYQLGNVISVQIWRRAVSELGDLEEQFARGEFTVATRVAARADLSPREPIFAAGAPAPGHRLGDRSGSVPRVSPRQVRVKVCVIGAGAIGSLLAAHLAKVADVSVLTRRDDHAQALNEHGLRVSGRHDFTARVAAVAEPSELPEFDLGIIATKATGVTGAAASLRGRFPGATIMTVQNGLGAEEIVRAQGGWPLVSAVTFMSGTKHSDTHVEYILDTPTWLGPYEGSSVRAGAGDRAAPASTPGSRRRRCRTCGRLSGRSSSSMRR